MKAISKVDKTHLIIMKNTFQKMNRLKGEKCKSNTTFCNNKITLLDFSLVRGLMNLPVSSGNSIKG